MELLYLKHCPCTAHLLFPRHCKARFPLYRHALPTNESFLREIGYTLRLLLPPFHTSSRSVSEAGIISTRRDSRCGAHRRQLPAQLRTTAQRPCTYSPPMSIRRGPRSSADVTHLFRSGSAVGCVRLSCFWKLACPTLVPRQPCELSEAEEWRRSHVLRRLKLCGTSFDVKAASALAICTTVCARVRVH
ncbi:hypothetical protein BC834DRAFT_335915 [Gloeopeniophorella convolvens]|nr:hypothetical protein BC834DRAFT_335915 [Gloeopeniophorella convolvens]